MIADRFLFGQFVAFTLAGHDVQQTRAFQRPQVTQRRHQGRKVVAVHRPKIVKTQFLKQGTTRREHSLDMLLGAAGNFQHRRDMAQHPLAPFPHAGEKPSGQQLGQVRRQCAHVRGDRHLVVVKHHQQVAFQITRMVKRLEHHTSGHSAVADHRHDFAVTPGPLGGNGHPQRGTERSAGMTDPEGIVIALATLGKTRDATFATQRVHVDTSPGQNFMGVGLVAHVPDQTVLRGVEDVVQGDG